MVERRHTFHKDLFVWKFDQNQAQWRSHLTPKNEQMMVQNEPLNSRRFNVVPKRRTKALDEANGRTEVG